MLDFAHHDEDIVVCIDINDVPDAHCYVLLHRGCCYFSSEEHVFLLPKLPDGCTDSVTIVTTCATIMNL